MEKFIEGLAGTMAKFHELGYTYSENYLPVPKNRPGVKVELKAMPIEGQVPFKDNSGVAVVLFPRSSETALAEARFVLLQHVSMKFVVAWRDER